MPSEETGRYITDPQETERLTSTLVQMFLEERDEAELERWLQTNIPNEIQQDLISIIAGTTFVDKILPQLRDSDKPDQVLGDIERFLTEARQRLNDMEANLE